MRYGTFVVEYVAPVKFFDGILLQILTKDIAGAVRVCRTTSATTLYWNPCLRVYTSRDVNFGHPLCTVIKQVEVCLNL